MSPGLGSIESPDQLEGSRAWRRAVKNLTRGSHYERLYRPSTFGSWKRFKRAWGGHIKDTWAFWSTEAGQVVGAVVSILFPPAAIALAAIALVVAREEGKILAAEMLVQQLRVCEDLPPEECPTSSIQDPLVYAEYVYGTTLPDADSGQITTIAAQILSKYLEDGGDEDLVLNYLKELENLRGAAAKGKFDHHVEAARARLPSEVNR